MNSASFSASFHLAVRRVASKSSARITARNTGIGWSRSQRRKSVSPRAFHSAWMSGRRTGEGGVADLFGAAAIAGVITGWRLDAEVLDISTELIAL
jgi:hypothetical protein